MNKEMETMSSSNASSTGKKKESSEALKLEKQKVKVLKQAMKKEVQNKKQLEQQVKEFKDHVEMLNGQLTDKVRCIQN